MSTHHQQHQHSGKLSPPRQPQMKPKISRSTPPILTRHFDSFEESHPPELSLFSLSLLILFTVVGALAFNEIEAPYELEKMRDRQIYIRQVQRRTVDRLLVLVDMCLAKRGQQQPPTSQNGTLLSLSLFGDHNSSGYIECHKSMSELLREHDQIELQINSCRNPYRLRWSFANALFYSISIYTTIGYGNVVCETMLGRILSMLYALIGIPLMLIVLNNFGQRIDHALHRFRRKLVSRFSSNPDGCSRVLPLVFAVSILVALLLLIAAMLSTYQSPLSFFEAFYFVFMSITTIGLGDIMPPSHWALIAIVPIMFGLSLFPMILNVVNDRYHAKMESMLPLIPNYGAKLTEKFRASFGSKKSSVASETESSSTECSSKPMSPKKLHRMDHVPSISTSGQSGSEDMNSVNETIHEENETNRS